MSWIVNRNNIPFIVLFLLAPSIAQAQTVVNPTKAIFTPSIDHNTTVPGVGPLVTNYQLDVMIGNSTGALAFSFNLLKPAPVGGTITVLIPGFATMMSNTSMVATVATVGPGGTTKSAVSNPFIRLTDPAGSGTPIIQ